MLNQGVLKQNKILRVSYQKITSEIIHVIIRMDSVNSEGHYQQHCFHESGNGLGMSPW